MLKVRKRPLIIAAAWLVLTLTLSAIALHSALNAIANDTQNALQQSLPPRLDAALQYSLDESEIYAAIAQQLNEDLVSIPVISSFALVEDCRARVRELRVSASIPASAAPSFMQRILEVSWEYGRDTRHSNFLLACQPNWAPLLSTRALLALLCVGLISLVPAPVTATQMSWRDALVAADLSAEDATRCATILAAVDIAGLAQFLQWLQDTALAPAHLAALFADSRFVQLSTQQQAWCRCALRQNPEHEHALQIALSPATLCFDSKNWSVTIHGLAISLSKTPWFYYLWYAYLRGSNTHDGWLLNPAVNRPEQSSGLFISTLMSAHGGHNRAIKELQENGLRAKTLDQNRNKLKEELLAVIDADLSNEFLFETNRDKKTARYAYRLGIRAERIQFDHALQSSLEASSKSL